MEIDVVERVGLLETGGQRMHRGHNMEGSGYHMQS